MPEERRSQGVILSATIHDNIALANIAAVIGESFASIRGVAGGAILGDGRIGLILDAHGLVGLKDGAANAA